MTNNIVLKTYSFYHKNKNDNKILNLMTQISKNIYNCTLYCYKIYRQFENNIYKDLLKYINTNKLSDYLNFDINKNEKKKDNFIKEIEEKLYEIYDEYYKFYSLNKNFLDNNNKIIYTYIINDLINKKIVIDKTNIFNLFNIYKNEIIKNENIIFNKQNENLVIDNIIISILKSCYYKTINFINSLLNKNQEKKIESKYNIIVESIKTNNFYIENINKYSKIIKNTLKIPITSVQNLIKYVSIRHLNENKEKIPADVIGNIIDKVYTNITGYYELLKSGKQKKVSFCKYLQKDDKFNLYYYCRSFKIEDNKIRLNVGEYINKNYNNINNIELDKTILNKKTVYFNKKDLTTKKIKKNDVEINNKFLEKSKLIKFNYIYFNLPKKIEKYEIKLIEIKSTNNGIKIYIVYDYICNEKLINYNFDKLSLEDKIRKSISIDTGICNLLTIYNPTGEQHIIKGGKILSINHFYNHKMDKLKSLNKKNYNKDKFKRLYNLENERQNKINGYFNNIVNELINLYKDKEVFIIGYNPNWKSNVNLGSKNNRNFYQIPYKRLIFKLDQSLKLINKKLIITKESYTSKCDALALEEINYHENYLGNRSKRGLFYSSINKLINADLNGAINIMRKKINLTEVIGNNLYNPTRINI